MAFHPESPGPVNCTWDRKVQRTRPILSGPLKTHVDLISGTGQADQHEVALPDEFPVPAARSPGEVLMLQVAPIPESLGILAVPLSSFARLPILIPSP